MHVRSDYSPLLVVISVVAPVVRLGFVSDYAVVITLALLPLLLLVWFIAFGRLPLFPFLLNVVLPLRLTLLLFVVC